MHCSAFEESHGSMSCLKSTPCLKEEAVEALPLISILKCSSISRIDGAVLLQTLGWPLGGGLCCC